MSGELSHHPAVFRKLHPEFIGNLSRMEEVQTLRDIRTFKILVILSGPEPLRTAFEQLCISQLSDFDGEVLILRGMPEISGEERKGSITLMPGASAEELKSYLLNTPVIICRPGYSTLMDLTCCGRNAILIPTPGQTEQEYLAFLHAGKGFITASQQNCKLPELIRNFKPQFRPPTVNTRLIPVISRVLRKIRTK